MFLLITDLFRCRRDINVVFLLQSEQSDALDIDIKEVVRILLGKRPILLEQIDNPSKPKGSRNTDHLILNSSPDLCHTSETSGSSQQAATSSTPDLKMGASTDKTSLLQDFILDGLSFMSMKDRQEEVAEAHRQTFEWIFDDTDETKPGSNFARWLKGDDGDGIYWINGKAGSGKSTLMQFMYNHKTTARYLHLWAGAVPLTRARFFFWTSGSLEQRSQIGLLRYLLFQLLKQHENLISIVFPDLWAQLRIMRTEDRIKFSMSWTLPQLINGLKCFLRHALGKTKICLFIDGLDEFDGDPGEIIDLFTSIVDSEGGQNTKVCLSSRPWPMFEHAFRSIPNLKLQDLTLDDMIQYVQDKFYLDPRTRRIIRKEPESGPVFMTDIVKRADGVFLWVTLVVRSLLGELRNGDKIADLRERLRMFPTNLDDLFRYTLFDTQLYSRMRDASRIFQLIHAREVVCDFTRNFSASSTTLWELALANAEEQDSTIQSSVRQASDEKVSDKCQEMSGLISSRCVGLLEIHDKQSKKAKSNARFMDEDSSQKAQKSAQSKVTYLHRTVRDFIVCPDVWNELLQQTIGTNFDPHMCHLKSYIMQLKLPLEEPEHHRRLDEWWPDIVLAMTHARYIQPLNPTIQSALLNDLNKTLTWYWLTRKDNDPNDTWARTAFGTYEGRKNTLFHDPFLSLAAKFGLAEYVAYTLSSENTDYKSGRPLLSYAIEFLLHRQSTVYPLSSPALVATILRHRGTDPNQSYHPVPSSREETPWLLALKLVRQAQRRGWVEYYDISEEGVPRWVAILKLFVEHGADPNALIVEDRWDPSATALEIVTMMLEKYGSKEVWDLREMLIEYGARAEGAGDGVAGDSLGNDAVES